MSENIHVVSEAVLLVEGRGLKYSQYKLSGLAG